MEEVRREVVAATERSDRLERQLEATRVEYEALQESYRGSVQSLARRLHEITAILREHQVRNPAVSLTTVVAEVVAVLLLSLHSLLAMMI